MSMYAVDSISEPYIKEYLQWEFVERLGRPVNMYHYFFNDILGYEIYSEKGITKVNTLPVTNYYRNIYKNLLAGEFSPASYNLIEIDDLIIAELHLMAL